MKTNYPDYNAINWISTIEKYAKRAEKYPLCKCRGIWITRNEITTIENLHDKVLERLAFTLLCLAKFNNFKNPQNNNWVIAMERSIKWHALILLLILKI